MDNCKGAWSEEPDPEACFTVWPATDDRYVCIDDSVTFSAACTTDPDGCGLIWTWSFGKDAYDKSDGNSDWEYCKYSTPGDRQVTLRVAERPSEHNPCCRGADTFARTVTVVEVASLLPDEGVEIDDGDGDPDTKSFVICIADSGVVTVTATPDPNISEEKLPGYGYSWGWELTGGDGDSLLFRTVDRTTAGVTTITCTCNTSSKQTKIYVVEVDLDISEVADDDEEDPGKYMEVNDLVAIGLSVSPSMNKGQVKLEAISGSSKIKVWENPTKETEVSLPKTWDLSSESAPGTLYVEGVSASTSVRDVELKLSYIADSTSIHDDNVKFTIYKVELKSVKFTSDHGVLKDNNSDWTDSGTTYSEPEWVADSNTNNPISHTKNVKLTVADTVKVSPSGMTFDLVGDGPNNYVDFNEPGNTSTGSDQEVTVTADANLLNQVDTLTKSISWTIKLIDPDPDIEENVGSSGSHKIYVTYGTLSGSVVTERRVREVCTSADGKSSLGDCADAVYDALKPKSYSPPPAPRNGPTPIWRIHDGEESQCPGLAMYIDVHFQMLGLGSGEIRYCWAQATSGSCTYDTTGVEHNVRRYFPVAGHSSPTTHDDVYPYERLRMIDGSSIWNNYEATCYFNSIYYALVGAADGKFTSPADVVTSCFYTDWYYRGGSSNWVECPELQW